MLSSVPCSQAVDKAKEIVEGTTEPKAVRCLVEVLPVQGQSKVRSDTL